MEFHEIVIRELSNMRWSDYLDILLVAYLIYRLLPLLRSAGSMKILRVVLLLLVVVWLTDIFNIYTMNFLLEQVMSVGILAVVIIFQPELRRLVDRVANVRLGNLFGTERNSDREMEHIITQTVLACEHLSQDKMGALIVFSREDDLEEYSNTGTAIDAQVSEQLLRNLFFVKAALHDGAVIVRGGRVAAAGCVLPLSDSKRLSADLGTRHRAGVGISEVSDAVVVIVSEETGTISVAVGGMLKRHLAPQTLERLLRNELCPEDPEKKTNIAMMLRQKLNRKGADEDEE